MTQISKVIKKEQHKILVQPGKAHREKRKEINALKRGQRVPEVRTIMNDKEKSKQRRSLKSELRKEVINY